MNEDKWDALQKDERWFWHNINDALGDESDPESVRIAQEQLGRKLREKYPEPSSFEKARESTISEEDKEQEHGLMKRTRAIR